MSREHDGPFVVLDFEPTGFAAVCEGIDCGDRQPYYRVTLGTFQRNFCETCLTNVLLLGVPYRSLPGAGTGSRIRHAIDPKQGGYMNPGGEF